MLRIGYRASTFQRKQHLGTCVKSIVLSLALTTCSSIGCKKNEPLALVHYAQLGACTKAQTGNGIVTVPASHAVIIFRVTSIDNSKVPQSWSFNSSNLVTNPPSAPQQNFGGQGPVSVSSKTILSTNVLVGIMVETAKADGSDAAETNYFLLYPRVAPAPGSVEVKDNSNQTKYPFTQDCNMIAGK